VKKVTPLEPVRTSIVRWALKVSVLPGW